MVIMVKLSVSETVTMVDFRFLMFGRPVGMAREKEAQEAFADGSN
jgi:hypothetical protein